MFFSLFGGQFDPHDRTLVEALRVRDSLGSKNLPDIQATRATCEHYQDEAVGLMLVEQITTRSGSVYMGSSPEAFSCISLHLEELNVSIALPLVVLYKRLNLGWHGRVFGHTGYLDGKKSKLRKNRSTNFSSDKKGPPWGQKTITWFLSHIWGKKRPISVLEVEGSKSFSTTVS
jgi:hypothetical protein